MFWNMRYCFRDSRLSLGMITVNTLFVLSFADFETLELLEEEDGWDRARVTWAFWIAFFFSLLREMKLYRLKLAGVISLML